MSDKTVVVIGADGTIGSALVCRLNEAGMDVWQTTRRRDCPGKHHLDLSDSREDWNLPISGTFAYLLAGQTSTAWCQANRDQARAINVDGTVSLAKELIDRGIRVIFVSSSLVFDGCLPATKADHPKSPRTEYGRQKAEAEDRLLELGDAVTIVRITKVLNESNELLQQWRRSLERNESIRPFSDLVVAPVSLNFASAALTRLTQVNTPRIVHISSTNDITYEEIARRLANRLNADPHLVQPIPCNGAIEHVPAYSTLDTAGMQKYLGIRPPDALATLDAVLSAL